MNLSFFKTFKSQHLDFIEVKNKMMCEEEKIAHYPQFKFTQMCFILPFSSVLHAVVGQCEVRCSLPIGYATADPRVQIKGIGGPQLFPDMLFKSRIRKSQSSKK